MLVHGLALWALLHIAAPAAETRASLLTFDIRPERKEPPKPVLSLPDFTPVRPPSIVAIMPEITTAPPPPRSAIVPQAPPSHPLPPSQQPAREQRASLPAAYIAKLIAHLDKYQHYPYEARVRREQGTVRLRFKMDRAGRVLSFAIAGSSGVPALDKEALEMIQRAQPLPPVPAVYPGATLTLLAPIVFSLH